MREQRYIVLAIFIGMAGIAFAFLGAFGVILFGLFIIFICASGELRENSPTSAVGRSPEERAAIAEERVRSVASLKFYRWCGFVLLVIGIAGFVWEQVQSR
jgi:uncharacterized protein (DUF58 family)